MLFFAFLLAQAGYTLAYAGATGNLWQDPWAYVAEALGEQVNPNPTPPQGATELAASFLGLVAFKAVLSSGGSLLGGNLVPAGGGGGEGAPAEEGASESEGVLSKIGDTLKSILSKIKGGGE